MLVGLLCSKVGDQHPKYNWQVTTSGVPQELMVRDNAVWWDFPYYYRLAWQLLDSWLSLAAVTIRVLLSTFGTVGRPASACLVITQLAGWLPLICRGALAAPGQQRVFGNRAALRRVLD